MFKKTMKFRDFDDKEVTKTFYFHYNALEIARMIEFEQLEEKTAKLTQTIEESGLTEVENTQQAYNIFEELVAGAYGIKSEDGLEFDKSPEITRRWRNHVAFPELIFELLGDANKAADFITNCLPPKMMEAAKAELEKTKPTSAEISEMVEVAAQRQEDPVTRVEPSTPDVAGALTDGKTDEEILAMKPNDLSKDQLFRAYQLKTSPQS